MMQISNDIELEIINYYLTPKSMNDTVKFFGLKNRYQLKKILDKYEIKQHSSEITKKLNIEATKASCLKKYGVENCMQVPEIINKAKITNLNKSVEERTEAINKQKLTKIAKYGSATYNNREKATTTNIIKYGTKSPMQNKLISDKVRQTNIEKYGVENPFQAEEVKDKIKKTCLDRYGNKNYTKTADYITKTNITCQTKYGVDYYCQSIEYNKVAHKKYKYDNTTFDSSWELALWIYAKDHNEEIERCPIKLSYSYNNKIYYCIPDFKYKGEIIEIKGDQFIKRNKFTCPYDKKLNDRFEAKQKCLLANNVKILVKQDIKFALDYVRNNYGKNYLKQFKIQPRESEN